MRLTQIVVENYRSLRSVEVDVGAFSVFVGQNNHGKTNLFEAIQWFYNAKASDSDEHFERDQTNPILVKLRFSEVVETDIEKLRTDAHRTKVRAMLDGAEEFEVLKRSTDHKRRYVVGGQDMGNPAGLDAAVSEFLPKLEYVTTKVRLDDVAKYKDKNPIGLMLSGVLTAIIESSAEYNAFREQFARLFESPESEVRCELDKLAGEVEAHLQRQFPDGTKVKFSVSPPAFTELLKSFDTAVDDGIETRASDKGDGMQRAIMLSIIQAFADHRRNQQGGGSFLFLIDEAEVHLHPSAQRALKRALLEISRTDQVLVNTHSSVMVVDDDPLQKIFKVEKEAHVSSVVEIEDIDKPDLVFELLGGSPADLLLPRNFLIVEGRCEYEFLKTVTRRFYANSYRGLKILFAGGDLTEQEGSLHGIHKVFSPLAGSENPIFKTRAVILLDKPNDQQLWKYNGFKAAYPYLFANGQVIELTTNSLEEYYPAPFTKTLAEAKQLEQERRKVAYAREVAAAISQSSFETDMVLLHAALQRCDQLGFSAV